jgi:hypothetical protein
MDFDRLLNLGCFCHYSPPSSFSPHESLVSLRPVAILAGPTAAVPALVVPARRQTIRLIAIHVFRVFLNLG